MFADNPAALREFESTVARQTTVPRVVEGEAKPVAAITKAHSRPSR